MIVPAITHTALIMGRLDQRLHGHPLLPAILFRERLEAARECAAVDGHLIDPWHLAAELEGLKPWIPGESAFERGTVIDASRAAYEQYLWLTRPGGERTARIDAALAALRDSATECGPLLGAAHGFHRWIDGGQDRGSMRGALVRFWREHNVLRSPLPLVGARAFAGDAPWAPAHWIPLFLSCLAEEATAVERRVRLLEQGWLAARARATGRRRTSRAVAALDLLAAFPLLSASRLAGLLGVSLKAAYLHLERFLADGLVVEVTHRAARRLFALKGLEPLREVVAPPRRAVPGRKRGRPRLDGGLEEKQAASERLSIPSVPPTLIATASIREPIDYAALEAALAAADAAIARFRNRPA